MSVTLSFTYVNFEGAHQTTILQYDRDALNASSKYFSAQISGNFSDSKMDSFNFDFTQMLYPLCEQYIKFIFDVATGITQEKKYENDTIEIAISSLKKKITYNGIASYHINDILLDNIPIHHCFTICQLNEYFMFNDIIELLTISIDNFYDNLVNMFGNTNSSPYITASINNKIPIWNNLSKNEMFKDINLYKKRCMIKEIIDELMFTFLSFKMLNKIDTFLKIMNVIKDNKSMLSSYPIKYVGIKEVPYIFNSTTHIGTINLCDYDMLLDDVKLALPVHDSELKLYDYYDMLHYEKHNFKVVNTQPDRNQEMILNNEAFCSIFTKVTNGMFDMLDWTNVIIGGEFLFNIVTNSNMESTNLDLYLYGKNNIIEEKFKYLINYFSSYTPYYIIKGSNIIIIIKELNFDIQIIPTKIVSPLEIINTFNCTYHMIYYDGTNLFTNLSGLISMKYRVTKFNKKLDKYWVQKIVTHGLEIVKHNKIKIKSDMLKFNGELDNMQQTIRMAMKQFNLNETINMLKLYYKSKYVFNTEGYNKFIVDASQEHDNEINLDSRFNVSSIENNDVSDKICDKRIIMKKNIQRKTKYNTSNSDNSSEEQIPLKQIPCKFGSDCIFNMNGRCLYYHANAKTPNSSRTCSMTPPRRGRRSPSRSRSPLTSSSMSSDSD